MMRQSPPQDPTAKGDPNWPPRPPFPPLPDNAARHAVFGNFNFVADPQPSNKEHIRILGTWITDNIVSVKIPQLAHVQNAPLLVQVHKKAADTLVALFLAWEKAGLIDRILVWNGSFVPRFVRGSTTTLSNHAFGSAFDINAAWNGLGQRPALIGEKGCTRELVPIAHAHGFYWGGHFKRMDGMHFEVAVLK